MYSNKILQEDKDITNSSFWTGNLISATMISPS